MGLLPASELDLGRVSVRWMCGTATSKPGRPFSMYAPLQTPLHVASFNGHQQMVLLALTRAPCGNGGRLTPRLNPGTLCSLRDCCVTTRRNTTTWQRGQSKARLAATTCKSRSLMAKAVCTLRQQEDMMPQPRGTSQRETSAITLTRCGAFTTHLSRPAQKA